MKLHLAAAAALVALTAVEPTMAAELPLPVKALPPAPWYDWTGFYLGLNGGYSWGRSSNDVTSAGLTPFSASQDVDGWLGGGQIGYNWQVSHNWLLGLEADFQGTGQGGSAALPTIITGGFPFAPGTIITGSLTQRLPWFGTARMRLGVEPADRWLLYATGGLAYGEVDTKENLTVRPVPGVPTSGTASASNTQAGWTVGVGTEWAMTPQWSAKLEYLYVDLGTFTDTFTGIGLPTFTLSSHFTDNVFRAGINYHFGGPIAVRD